MSEIERRKLCESTPTPNVSASTAPPSTNPSTEAPTLDAANARAREFEISKPSLATAHNSDPCQDNPSPSEPEDLRTASTDFPAATSELDSDSEPEERSLELRKFQAHSLAETLLISLNIPYDERSHEVDPVRFTIEPPVTAAKVAAQIAEVSNAILAGTIAPDQAKAVLFALQTMLTAIRVNVMEQKANQQRTTEPARRAPRSAPKCQPPKARKLPKTVSSPSPRKKKSRSRRRSG